MSASLKRATFDSLLRQSAEGSRRLDDLLDEFFDFDSRYRALVRIRGPSPVRAQAPADTAGNPGRVTTTAASTDTERRGIELAKRVLDGDWRALARSISVIENDDTAAGAVVATLYPRTGHAHVIGITGPPGAGKSTLVDALAAIIRKDGRTVGIVAVDPTSPFTGGAVLGDRVRMQRHAGDPGVFIRSMASRRSAGGLAPATRDVVRALDAFGRDIILIETVGVGQIELEIMKVADTVVVVTVPGLGDGVQTIKAGLLEIADIFVVNMADRPGAHQTVADLKIMLTLGGAEERRRRWKPPILETIATQGEGVAAVWEACQSHHRVLESDERMGRSHDRLRDEVVEAVQRRIGEYVAGQLSQDGAMEPVLAAVLRREIDPRAAAERIVAHHLKAEPRRSR